MKKKTLNNNKYKLWDSGIIQKKTKSSMGEISARSKKSLNKPIDYQRAQNRCYSSLNEKDYFEISRISASYEGKTQNVDNQNKKTAYKYQLITKNTFKRYMLLLIVNLIINLRFELAYSQELNDNPHSSKHLHSLYTDEKQNVDTFVNRNIISISPNELNELLAENNNFLDSINNDFLKKYEKNNSKITYVKFYPNHLDFGERQIGHIKIETIYIINTGEDELTVEIVSGNTEYFQFSLLTDKIILPGKNVSIQVYFIPREVGIKQNLLFVNTNKGLLIYNISGTSVENRYGLKPILNQRIFLSSSLLFQIKLFNFHNDSSIQIREMFTSDDDLHFELVSKSQRSSKEDDNLSASGKTKNTQKKTNHLKLYNSKADQSFWTIKPLEKKKLATARFIGHHTSNHTGFIFVSILLIKSNVTLKFMLPFEIEVVELPDVYSPINELTFGQQSFKPFYPTDQDVYFPSFMSNNERKNLKLKQAYLSPYLSLSDGHLNETLDIYLFNKRKNNLHIKNIYIKNPISALSIEFVRNLVLIGDPKRLTKVASVHFDVLSDSFSEGTNGKIVIEMKENIVSEMDFKIEKSQLGSLNYNQNQLKFLISSEENVSKIVKSVDFMNTFKFPLVVNEIELSNAAKNYFELRDLKESVLILYPTSNMSDLKLVKTLFGLEFKREKYLEERVNETDSTRIRNVDNYFESLPTLTLRTNLTSFKIPIFVYDRNLKFSIVKYEKESRRTTTINQYDFIQNLNEENDLGYILVNSVRKVQIVIYNINPINISIDELKLVQIGESEHLQKQTEFELKLLRLEPLNSLNSSKNNFMENETINFLAHHRIIIQLEFRNRETKKKENTLDTYVLKYALIVATKFQTEKLRFKLVRVNGLITLVDPINSNQLDDVVLSTYPGLVNIIPINMKSTFNVDLHVKSIEFKKFGSAFNFLWTASKTFGQQDNSQNTQQQNKKEILNTIGRIKANSLNQIGLLEFDFRKICSSLCYLGLNHDSVRSNTDLDICNQHFDQHTNLYQNWYNTFQVENKDKYIDLFQVDSQIFECMRKKFDQIKHLNQAFFNSKLNFEVIQKNSVVDSVSAKNLNFTFSFSFRAKWPRLLTEYNGLILLPIIQASSSYCSKQIKLRNPTNQTILVQLMLIENYPQKEELLDLIEKYDHLFRVNKFLDMKELRKQLYSTGNSKDIFKFHFDYSKEFITMKKDLNLKQKKYSLDILLEPNTIQTFQINFESKIPGTFHSALIVRNNLTILEVHTLRADAGMAFLKINDLAPMKTSTMLEQFYESKKIAQYEDEMNDISLIQISMKNSDISLCQKGRNEPFSYLINFYQSIQTLAYAFVSNSYSNSAHSTQRSNEMHSCCNFSRTEKIMRLNESRFKEKIWPSSFKNEDGIVLRDYLALKNTGNSDLVVQKIFVDNEPCSSSGFSIPYCTSFVVPALTDEFIYLEINYQPDFTMAMVDKRLNLKTSIGDLEYIIQFKIPYHVLSMCHDSLPRPSVETFLLYLILFASSSLFLFVVFSAFIDSRNIFAFQKKVKDKIFTLNEDSKQLNVQNFVSEYQVQADKNNSLKLVNQFKTNSNSISASPTSFNKTKNKIASNGSTINAALNKQTTKSPPLSPSSSKNANKSPKNRQNTHKTTLETSLNSKSRNSNEPNDKKMGILNKKPNEKLANLNSHRKLSKTKSESLCVEQLKLATVNYNSTDSPVKGNLNLCANQSNTQSSIKNEKDEKKQSAFLSSSIQKEQKFESKPNNIKQIHESLQGKRKGSSSSASSNSSRSQIDAKEKLFKSAHADKNLALESTIQNENLNENAKKYEKNHKFEENKTNSLVLNKNPSEISFQDPSKEMNTTNQYVSSKPIEDNAKLKVANSDQKLIKQLTNKSKSATNQQTTTTKEQLMFRSKEYPLHGSSLPFDSDSEHVKQTISFKRRSVSMESVQINKSQLVDDEDELDDEYQDNQLTDDENCDIHELLESLKRESFIFSHSSPSSIGNRSSSSTPVSDIWIMPDLNTNDNCLGDDFMDENYDNLVRETEEFSMKNCAFDVQQQKTITKNKKNLLLKTISSPLPSCSHEFDLDFERFETFAPIERQTSSGKLSTLNTLNSNKLDPFEAQYLENQNAFIVSNSNNHQTNYFDYANFKDLKLFDKPSERDEKENCKDETSSNMSCMNLTRNVNLNKNRIWNSVIFDSYASSSLQSPSGTNNIKMLWADEGKKEN